jgi:nicotinate-nucleotide pyrophosphorylase (carboxylating)
MHNQLTDEYLQTQRRYQVIAAIAEDLGQSPDAPLRPDADLTANLVNCDTAAQATIICREAAVICGQSWVNEVFASLDQRVTVTWHCREGGSVSADTLLCSIAGPARALLTGERPALNFLQTLSGTATTTRRALAAIPADSQLQLLDTRKTLPGLRAAQKYAVRVGGGSNHRIGLFDAFLIKENHIAACGGIAAAIARARQIGPGKPVEVEVESFDELEQALTAGADIIMLDEFNDDDLPRAVALNAGRAKLEVSGSVHSDRLRVIANAGVDFVSMGALTKHVQAIDLSMRIQW